MNEKVNKKQYMPLVVAAGIGSRTCTRNHYRFIGNSYGMAEWPWIDRWTGGDLVRGIDVCYCGVLCWQEILQKR